MKKDRINTYCFKLGQEVVAIDSRYFRPTEVDLLVGDATKAKKKLNWSPKISLNDMIIEMIENDLEIEKNRINIKN